MRKMWMLLCSYGLGLDYMIGMIVQDKLHINLFITRFIRTQFWILHRSKMDPKKCIDYIEK